MSFSAELKEELSKVPHWKDKQNVKAELVGYLTSRNMEWEKNKLYFSTENSHNINRFGKLLTNLQMDFTIEIQGKVYRVACQPKIDIEKELAILCDAKDSQIEYKRAFLRGVFLGSGLMSDPNKTYHLEILFANLSILEKVQHLLETWDIPMKKQITKNKYSLYLKDGESISHMLALMEASKSMLQFEQIRVLREMKSKVNRTVNCETANLNKIVNNAVKQMEDIEFLKKKKLYKTLPDHLKEMAEVRIQHPEASLMELGKLLENPIGKSGVNYRLKQISQIAEEARKEK